ncbi:hypothetical protein L2Q04_07600 [Staphylococcus aureus]|nr:hypothetical protein [Staphylococcus aureus]HCW7465527.1 hypothetical protein [Staphylococcus aureus]
MIKIIKAIIDIFAK